MSFKRKILLTTGILIVLVIITVVAISIFRSYNYNRQIKADLELLSTEEYDSIFCSMYSIENFAEEDFVTYRGVNTLKLSNVLRDTDDLGSYIASAFNSGNGVEIVYLGLDPAQIWSSVGKDITKWNSALTEDIIAHATAHPEVTFEVLLPAPSFDYWKELGSKDTEEILTTYHSLISTLSPYHNITTYFMGGEYWLIANPGNYDDNICTNEIISQKIFLFTFCDHEFQVTAENAALYIDALKSLITQEETAPEHPDLSSWDVVFFGDSIIGNYTGSYSVPGVLTGLSDARTYNCAQGGIPASLDANSLLSFPTSVDYFIGQDAAALPELSGPFPAALDTYSQDKHNGRRLCFVINFGLNDYFGGHPVSNPEDAYDVSTYAGALRVGIDKLQTAYPDAEILLMTPNFITFFTNGTEILGENSGILIEYVDTAMEIANEYNVICLNNYTDLGINETTASVYLADGVHLNETGRFLLAKRIMERIAALP